MVINDFEKINVNINTSQIEQWSIFSNVINYVQYNRDPIDYYKLDVKALEPKNHKIINGKLEEDDGQVIDLDFGDTPEEFKGEYLDVYERVRLEIL